MLIPSRCDACARARVATELPEAKCLDHEDGLRSPLKASLFERVGPIGPVPRLMVGAPLNHTPPSFEEIILEPIKSGVVRRTSRSPYGRARMRGEP